MFIFHTMLPPNFLLGIIAKNYQLSPLLNPFSLLNVTSLFFGFDNWIGVCRVGGEAVMSYAYLGLKWGRL